MKEGDGIPSVNIKMYMIMDGDGLPYIINVDIPRIMDYMPNRFWSLSYFLPQFILPTVIDVTDSRETNPLVK